MIELKLWASGHELIKKSFQCTGLHSCLVMYLKCKCCVCSLCVHREWGRISLSSDALSNSQCSSGKNQQSDPKWNTLVTQIMLFTSGCPPTL